MSTPPAEQPSGALTETTHALPNAPAPSDTAIAPRTESANPDKQVIKKKKRRPARPQVDPDTFKGGEIPPQTGTVFNIWYNKWSGGDREDKYISKNAAAGRCNIARDSGYTKADKVPGSYFCLFFARGLCPRGAECEYLHRLPGVHDIFNPNVDCFGRDKFSDYRDDMGGVGSFMRQNHTLYVGRIHVSDDIEEVVARHFAEWGQVERIRVLNSRGVGFVTYTNEANAQFAKEAMAHQSLDHNEILNVRWATQDPNPAAQAREKRRVEEQAAAAIRAALPAEYVAELEGKDKSALKRRRIEGSFGLRGYDAPDEVWYAGVGGSAAIPEDTEANVPKQLELGQKDEPGVEETNGIFTSSALGALKDLHASGGTRIGSGAQPHKPPFGLALDYGSDSD
ncbi:putative cell cycle control protein [Ascodesmis nigricans]|uniref:Pre-mRNA-splicing factor CWC2 n=1 Tax=Ascodesmis nigricans TaxID=341454 RepID=A0A4S2MYD9_9PEZI|nr:putative cell cycle control protein [Ascodesmis nigricans]